MAFKKQELRVLSSNGTHKLAGVVFVPTTPKPVGFFQVVHGMTEYIGRYERFMSEMAEQGWICFGHDHLGHGHTVNNASELGFIAPENGADLLQRDVKRVADAVIKHYTSEGTKLPYVLMGHSMGSFVVRLAVEKKYVAPDKLIVMGTGGPNPIAGVGLAFIGIIKACKGPRHISPFIDKMAFGGYNKKFDDGDSDPRAWLTKDGGVREKYANDPFCNYKFTVSAMGDLIRLTKDANRGAWFKSLPEGLPILLVSGRDDPVGDFGKGVETVCARLQKAGHPVTCRLYNGYRHEILNDASHDRVVADILDFLR